MLRRLLLIMAVMTLVASPCAAGGGIAPNSGWLWSLDVAVDDFRAWVNPALVPLIEAERIDEAHQMIAAGDVVAAQQAMNHVMVTEVSITPLLDELEASEAATWHDIVSRYGVSNLSVDFVIPQRLERVPDGEYVFTVTTTSGEELGTYTALKSGDVAQVQRGDACGSCGKVRLHWTYTVQDMRGFVAQYERIR